MFDGVKYAMLAKLFKEAGKKIEKTDWMTKVLTKLFDVKFMKDRRAWGELLNGIDSMLTDAKDEVRQARKWVD